MKCINCKTSETTSGRAQYCYECSYLIKREREKKYCQTEEYKQYKRDYYLKKKHEQNYN